MKISKNFNYLAIISFFTIGLVTSWIIPTIFILNNINDSSEKLSKLDLFLNVMGSHSNFLSYNRIMILYLLVFIFTLNYIFFKDNPSLIIRLKSRNSYVNKHIKDIIFFSLIFAVLIEVVNVVFSAIFFGFNITATSGLLLYSAIDLLTEFLFYMRAGIIMFIAGICINKKVAPFISLAIYFLEYFTKDYFPFLYNIWLPYKDSVQVTSLIMKTTQPTDVIIIIIRGLIINSVLIFLSYYLFKKKDIVNNEKK